jgi:hypothetical protein
MSINQEKPKDIISYCLGIVLLLVATYFSYRNGEKLYFLIPLIGFPISYVQCWYFLPTIWLFMQPEKNEFKGVNISSLKRFSIDVFQLEMMMSVFFLTFMIFSGKFVLLSITYACYAVLCMTFTFVYLKRKFYLEATKQGIQIEYNYKMLVAEIKVQYRDRLQKKIPS